MNARTYYEILQVARTAEAEVIEAAYRRLATKYHPDKNPDASAKTLMSELNDAYAVLSNPEQRRAYDQELSQQEQFEQLTTLVNNWLSERISDAECHHRLVNMGVDSAYASSLISQVIEFRRTNGLEATPVSIGTWLNSQINRFPFLRTIWEWGKFVLTIVLGVFAIFFLLISVYTLIFPISTPPLKVPSGQLHKFGQSQIYVEEGVALANVEKFGNYLLQDKIDTILNLIQLHRTGNRYEIRILNWKKPLQEKDNILFAEFGDDLSNRCFDERPVDIHFCNEEFKPLKVIPYTPKIVELTNFSIYLVTSQQSQEVQLKSLLKSDLVDVSVNMTLWREDGKQVIIERFWSTWSAGSDKAIVVEPHRYQKIKLAGTGLQRGKKVNLAITVRFGS